MAANINILPGFKRVLSYEIELSKTAVKALSVSVFIVLMALGAYVRIPLPFTPVPVTLQTLFIMLAAVCLGRGLAGLSQLGYLLLGCLGMPVFAGAASGISHLTGVTGGYLIGFVLAAYIIGLLMKLRDGLLWTAFSFLSGFFVLYLSGTLWLKVSMNVTFQEAFSLGVVPFMPGGCVKIIAALSFYKTFRNKFKGF